jgi:hypothetical protein
MITFAKIKRMLRGEVSLRTAVLEAWRRTRAALERRRERAALAQFEGQPARLGPEFSLLPAVELLAHFRSRSTPEFFPGFAAGAQQTAVLQQDLFPDETNELINQAKRMVNDHCWTLLGFGEKCFGLGEIDWNLDPQSGFDWPLSHHADIALTRNDGSDVRVVWELNRLGHFIIMGRAYALTDNQRFSTEFFRQLATWRDQNPLGRGVNWNCAMEVALRAINLLAAFELFLRAPQMNETELTDLLRLFDQHGAHIRRNLEFSHIATSNHYLADVTGLLWLGLMLPELAAAADWREFGLRELLSEMNKQVLPDGADYEASTGYHRLKLELFLYSFVLCHLNAIEIDKPYWDKLRGMIEYLRAYLRPDGHAPLIGDSDSGQALPIVRHAGDEHAYVLALGAAIFREPRFKTSDAGAPEDLLWIFGGQGLRDYQALPTGEPAESQAFTDAGTYLMRLDDLYLLFNASGSGVDGRGSHGHNDALGVEVSAYGSAFIVDPGAYVYTADLHERQLFRSTAYHSTVEVDGVEQNTTDEQAPFVIGNEAAPRVISWESAGEHDSIVAEHYGYQRLSQPLTHRRSVKFDKRERQWLVEDSFKGSGEHQLSFRFHLAPGLEITLRSEGMIEVYDKMKGARLLIIGAGLTVEPVLEERFSSRDYGAKVPSVSVCWSVQAAMPFAAQFILVPVDANEDMSERLKLAVDVCSPPKRRAS